MESWYRCVCVPVCVLYVYVFWLLYITIWFEKHLPVYAQLCHSSQSAVFSIKCKETHMLGKQSKQNLFFPVCAQKAFINASNDG